MNAAYQTLIVKFSEPIKVLDGIFDDAEAWGVDTLKKWIDDYESSRFTAIDSHTAVITSEYNMECLMEWLKRNDFTADRRQTLCRHDGKQGLHRHGQRLAHEPCKEQDEREPP